MKSYISYYFHIIFIFILHYFHIIFTFILYYFHIYFTLFLHLLFNPIHIFLYSYFLLNRPTRVGLESYKYNYIQVTAAWAVDREFLYILWGAWAPFGSLWDALGLP